MDDRQIITYEQRKLDPSIIKGFIDPELSEPYSLFTYYYFLEKHPQYTYMVR